MYNMASKRCGKLNIAVICSAHIYEGGDASFKQRTMSGGMGAIYLSSVIIELTRKTETDKNTKQRTGIWVTAKVWESRFSIPRSLMMYISMFTGLNQFLGMHSYFGSDTGIYKGRLSDQYDVCNELLKKKKLTKENLLEYSFTVKDLEPPTVSKDKYEYVYQNLKKNIEKGLIYIVGGGELEYGVDVRMKFGPKCLESFDEEKYTSSITEDDKVGVYNETSPKYVVEHLNQLMDLNELFRPSVFNDEVMDKLSAKIEPLFRYNKTMQEEDVDNFLKKNPVETEETEIEEAEE
jgi:hypothetical protein